MLWDIFPFLWLTWPIGWLFDIFLFPFWFMSAWVDIAYNLYVVTDFFVDLFLLPYYCIAEGIVMFKALKNRPMYTTNAEDLED